MLSQVHGQVEGPLPVRCCSDTRDRCVRTEHVGPVSLALHPFIRHGQGHITGGSDETVALHIAERHEPNVLKNPDPERAACALHGLYSRFLSSFRRAISEGVYVGELPPPGHVKAVLTGDDLQLRVRLESWFAVACPLLVQQCKEDLLDFGCNCPRGRV